MTCDRPCYEKLHRCGIVIVKDQLRHRLNGQWRMFHFTGMDQLRVFTGCSSI